MPRWISRRGQIQWTQKKFSCKLLLAVGLCYVRSNLYRNPRPRNLEKSKAKLVNLLNEVEIDKIRSPYKSFLRRCKLCSENDGGHLEEFSVIFSRFLRHALSFIIISCWLTFLFIAQDTSVYAVSYSQWWALILAISLVVCSYPKDISNACIF